MSVMLNYFFWHKSFNEKRRYSQSVRAVVERCLILTVAMVLVMVM